MKNLKSIFSVIAFVLFTSTVFAQLSDTVKIQRNEKGKISFALFKQNLTTPILIQSDTAFLKSILKAKNEDEFSGIKE